MRGCVRDDVQPRSRGIAVSRRDNLLHGALANLHLWKELHDFPICSSVWGSGISNICSTMSSELRFLWNQLDHLCGFLLTRADGHVHDQTMRSCT